MNHFDSLVRQIKNCVFGVLLLSNVLLLGLLWVSLKVYNGPPVVSLVLLAVVTLVVTFGFSLLIVRYVTEPIKFLWQAVLHVAPEHSGTVAPNLDKVRVGRQLVTSLILQIYQFASHAPSTAGNSTNNQASTIANNLPIPTLVMDKNQTVVFVNQAALQYLQLTPNDLLGKNAYNFLDFSFPSEQTFDSWLKDSRANKLTASQSWDRVRLKLPNQNRLLQLDMAAYYNKDNPTGVETILTLFDRTSRYSKDDQALDFVALAVHELRSPLTILRGYIEVFDDEFAGKLTPELAGFMHRMQAAAQQLASFVNNILNVARVEADQLTLRLQSENWSEIVKRTVADLNLEAQVHQKTIELQLAPDLPLVGVDRVSILEVLTNLIDNAIKYSGEGPKKIIVRSVLRPDGFVETTVQDFGIGIPSSVVTQLFEKFYRSHRTQTQIGGTGLGLYLSKAIIEAHGGQIWVQSKPGEGSTFGFTLQPYAQLADSLKTSDNHDIVRTAHGWIKNHSLYRR